MTKKIWFDMDGTIADLYAVDGWLEMLRAFDATPYLLAKPLVNMSALAKAIHRAQANGCEVGIISWSSKVSTPEYDALVEQAKRAWLRRHLPSVQWDSIHVVPYGTPKREIGKVGILFDDEARNIAAWGFTSERAAFQPSDIFEVMREMARG